MGGDPRGLVVEVDPAVKRCAAGLGNWEGDAKKEACGGIGRAEVLVAVDHGQQAGVCGHGKDHAVNLVAAVCVDDYTGVVAQVVFGAAQTAGANLAQVADSVGNLNRGTVGVESSVDEEVVRGGGYFSGPEASGLRAK